MDTETRAAFDQTHAAFGELRAETRAGFAETRAAFARIDHWFELIQAQHIETRRDIDELRTGQDDLRMAVTGIGTELRDGFESVDNRLASIERDVGALWAESRAHGPAMIGLSDRVSSLTERVASLAERMGGLERRVDSMSEDMRQRFRVVIERLAALEHLPR